MPRVMRILFPFCFFFVILSSVSLFARFCTSDTVRSWFGAFFVHVSIVCVFMLWGGSDWCGKTHPGAVPPLPLRLSVFVLREEHGESFFCTNRCLCRRGVIGYSSSFCGLIGGIGSVFVNCLLAFCYIFKWTVTPPSGCCHANYVSFLLCLSFSRIFPLSRCVPICEASVCS